MNIETILQKGQAGEKLSTDEVKALMLHAIDLLKYINSQTQASILRAYELIKDAADKQKYFAPAS